MHTFFAFLASIALFVIGLGAGFFLGQKTQNLDKSIQIIAEFEKKGIPPGEIVNKVTEIGSGLEEGEQVGAIASMRALDFIKNSQPQAAEEILSMVIVHYYNTHGPARNPNYYVGENGKNLLSRIEHFANKHPEIKIKLKPFED